MPSRRCKLSIPNASPYIPSLYTPYVRPVANTSYQYLYSVSLGLNLPIDEGQTMRCKDFSKLDKWTIDHHSCFKYTHVNEEEPLTEMHQWRNCPKDSPYGQKMRALLGYDENWVPEFKQNFGPEFPEGYDDRVIGEH